MMLHPHERGRQTAASQYLDDPATGGEIHVQPTIFARPGQAVEPLRGEQVEVGGGDLVAGIHRHRGRRQHIRGQPTGSAQDRG